MALLYLLGICLIYATTSAITTQSQVPESFAFITVTHTRGNNYKNIQTHIDRYAMLDCPIATELNIVWNNAEPPQQAPLFSRQSQWKRPVYFFATPNNSMDWRYKVPAQSKAKVYFIVDDDVNIDCTELKRGFKKWQENAIGHIAPLVTYAVRFFEYTQQEGFKYGKVKERDMFSLGLVGLSFMSRHFMDLYYAKEPIIEAMRAIVRAKNNCDDIGINWLIQYFYPELEVIHLEAVKGNLLANSPAIAQSTSSTHYPYRNQCIKQFTLLFGVNPLRYKPINDKHPHPEWRIKPNKESIVLQKQKYLEAIISGKQQEEKAAGKEENEAVSELQNKLADLKQANSKLQDERDSLISQLEKGKQNQQQQISTLPQQQQNFSTNDLLLFSTLSLTILVILLSYKVISLAHEKKMLLKSYDQKGTIVSSIQADSGSDE